MSQVGEDWMEFETSVRTMRHNLARAPLPVVRRIPGKTWAGALISNLDEAFGFGRLARAGYGNEPNTALEVELDIHD